MLKFLFFYVVKFFLKIFLLGFTTFTRFYHSAYSVVPNAQVYINESVACAGGRESEYRPVFAAPFLDSLVLEHWCLCEKVGLYW